MNLDWQTCTGGKWCSFEGLNLDHDHFNNMEGVYIIWHTGDPGKVVYVGQGDIATRIADHRDNSQILKYKSAGTLRVTWAKVGSQYRDGVERYLADTWNPLVGDTWPDVTPIEVNSPWK